MADINSYGLSRENQRLFINNEEIPGVQSADFGYSVNGALIKYMGMTSCDLTPDSPYGGTVSISTLLISDDPFIKYTGTNGCNGYLIRSRTDKSMNFGFQSGFLTSYSHRCSIGQIPTLDASFDIVGNIGNLSSDFSYIQQNPRIFVLDQPVRSKYEEDKNLENKSVANDFNNITNETSNLLFKVATPQSIVLTLDESRTNRVVSYDISLAVNRLPIFSIGKTRPNQVEIIYPIEVTCSFKLEIDNYKAGNMRYFPFNRNVQNLSIALNDFETSAPIFTYTFPKMTLINEGQNFTTEEFGVLNLTYKGYITR